MATKKITLNELRGLVKQILKENVVSNMKNFALAIDDESNRYFITKKDDDTYYVIDEQTKKISEMTPKHAKKLFRLVGDATDYENSEMNKLINKI